jgi:hypothetical protein
LFLVFSKVGFVDSCGSNYPLNFLSDFILEALSRPPHLLYSIYKTATVGIHKLENPDEITK